MAQRARAPGERRLFLDPSSHSGALHAGARLRLTEGEAEHAGRVLRLAAGDEFVGLDGRGSAWQCRILAVERRGAAAEALELLARDPEPGSGPGAPARIVAHVAWPRPGPAEEMADRLTQLGVSAIVPLATARSGPHARDFGTGRRERLERILREALKQCGRTWLPELAEPCGLEQLAAEDLPEASALLAPQAELGFLAWATARRAAGTRSWSIFVGPEGGWTEEEEAALVARGARRVRLAQAVLRIETAAEAALAVLAALEAEPPARAQP